jgi:hypothetical protein
MGTDDLSECPKIETRWVGGDRTTECQGCIYRQLHPSKFSRCHRLPQDSLSSGTLLPLMAPLDAQTVGSMAFHASVIPVLRYIRPKRPLLIRSLLHLSFKSSAYERWRALGINPPVPHCKDLGSMQAIIQPFPCANAEHQRRVTQGLKLTTRKHRLRGRCWHCVKPPIERQHICNLEGKKKH